MRRRSCEISSKLANGKGFFGDGVEEVGIGAGEGE
jgi:hypothetical protein